MIGKRVNSFPSTLGTVETFHTKENLQLYTNSYAIGTNLGSNIYSPFYDNGEGWLGPPKGPSSNGGTFNYLITVNNIDLINSLIFN